MPVSRPAQVRRLDVFAAAAGKQARSIVLVELAHVRKVSGRAPLVCLETQLSV